MSNRTNNIFLLEFFLWLRALLTFVPATVEYSPMVLNVGTVLIVYSLLLTSAGGRFVARTFLIYLPLYLIVAFNVIWGYKTDSIFTFIYGLLQWMIWPIAIGYLVREKRVGATTRLYVISTLFILLTAITTYFGNESIPGASRALAAIWSEETETAHFYRKLNIGGFEFAYLLTLMVPLWVFVIRARVNKWHFIYSIIAIVVSLFSIYKTEYTTALLFALGGLLLFAIPKLLTTKRLMLFFAIFAAVLVVGDTVVSSFAGRIADTTESGIFAERLGSISDYMLGRRLEGDAGTRQELLLQSWNAFIQNPLTGTGKVGGHSLILDTIGRFGIFGILFLCIVFVGLYKNCVKPQKGTLFYGYLLFIYICQIGLAFLNTTIIFEFFFIFAPLVGMITQPKNKMGYFTHISDTAERIS